MRGTFLGAVTILLCAMPAMIEAAVINGGFETGNLSGWTLAGQGSAQTSSIGVTPTVGTYQGYIETTGNFTVSAPAVATSLGLPGSAIAAFGAGPPFNGTALSQSVTVSAGDVLSFDWDFATDELNEDPTFDDIGFFTINTSAFLLASRNSSTYDTVSPPPGFDGQTDYATRTFTFPSAGTYTVGFGVLNVGDAGHDSALFLDNISLPGVPEPASAATFLGIATTYFLRRARR